MIEEITSSLSGFKTFALKRGLNIIVAEKHSASGVKDTRNGTGKTSLIELIHFVLADRKQSTSDFHNTALSGASFTVRLRGVGAEALEITKSVTDGNESLALNGENIERPDLRKKLSLDWFQLSSEMLEDKYSPTFGALFGYFVRKERNGGFANAVNNSAQQKGWDMQVNLSYLLNFDWKLPQNLQVVKDRKKDADELHKMLKKGLLDRFDLDPQRMQARLDVLDTEVEYKRGEIRNAVVVDDYRGRESTANSITIEIRKRNELNLMDLNLLEDITTALDEVATIDESDIERLYNEVGVVFPEQVSKRFEQVRSFHRAVARNRQKHLENERGEAKRRLALRKTEIGNLQNQLRDHLSVLSSGLAIERYASLQTEMTELESEKADLQLQIPRIRRVDEERKKMKVEIDQIVDLIGLDVLERRSARTTATKLFAEISRDLYDEPGELSVSKSSGSAGLAIDTNIRGKKSGGKSHMQIFCFDLMLAITAKKYLKFPGFLVHDSHIFDGVDGRQIGLALDVANRKCKEHGIQYIIAMNSDDLEKIRVEEVESGETIFDPAPYINLRRLTDDDTGGLFGVRF